MKSGKKVKRHAVIIVIFLMLAILALMRCTKAAGSNSRLCINPISAGNPASSPGTVRIHPIRGQQVLSNSQDAENSGGSDADAGGPEITGPADSTPDNTGDTGPLSIEPSGPSGDGDGSYSTGAPPETPSPAAPSRTSSRAPAGTAPKQPDPGPVKPGPIVSNPPVSSRPAPPAPPQGNPPVWHTPDCTIITTMTALIHTRLPGSRWTKPRFPWKRAAPQP